jgi:hypothetical protein
MVADLRSLPPEWFDLTLEAKNDDGETIVRILLSTEINHCKIIVDIFFRLPAHQRIVFSSFAQSALERMSLEGVSIWESLRIKRRWTH